MKKLSVIMVLVLVAVLAFALPALAVNPVNKVLVTVTAAGAGQSNVAMSWDAVTPVGGGTISYTMYKSLDGGKTYGAGASLGSTTNYSDNGVTNYTDITYKITVTETGGSSPGSVDKLTNVYPPDTNAHANFATNTNQCANCHQTHTAQGAKLLQAATTLATCQSCHWGVGTNSKYNVKDGETSTATGKAPSLGGPMSHTAGAGDQWGNKGTTSAHEFDPATSVTAPGGYNATQSLTCTSCHGAHETGNYRQIQTAITYPDGPSTTTTATVTFRAAAAAPVATAGESASYLSGSVGLCAACHSDYNAATTSGHTAASGTFVTNGKYRHAVNVAPASYGTGLTTSLPLEGTNATANQNMVVCLTCHYAHGTVATGAETSSVSGSSTMLKRIDNMGVCEDCHKK